MEAQTKARFRVFTPDAQYRDDGAVERTTAGPDFSWDIFKERNVDAIPEEAFQSCDAMVVWHEVPINAALIARLKRCRVIVRAGVGYDHVDIEAAGAAGIPVCNTPDYGTSEVADHAIALMLALRRGIVTYQDALRRDPVHDFDWSKAPLVRRIRGSRFGVLGLGRIGTATALRAKAFGCDVLAYDPYAPRGQEIALGVNRIDDFEAFLSTVDVLSVHTPLTEETRNMIDKRVFAAMQRHALLINTARGGIVDLQALYQALKDNLIAGAGVDVFPREPADPKHPFWKALQEQPDWIKERVIVSPHAAWYSPESQHDARRLAVETMVAYLRTGQLRNCVNEMFLRR